MPPPSADNEVLQIGGKLELPDKTSPSLRVDRYKGARRAPGSPPPDQSSAELASRAHTRLVPGQSITTSNVFNGDAPLMYSPKKNNVNSPLGRTSPGNGIAFPLYDVPMEKDRPNPVLSNPITQEPVANFGKAKPKAAW